MDYHFCTLFVMLPVWSPFHSTQLSVRQAAFPLLQQNCKRCPNSWPDQELSSLHGALPPSWEPYWTHSSVILSRWHHGFRAWNSYPVSSLDCNLPEDRHHSLVYLQILGSILSLIHKKYLLYPLNTSLVLNGPAFDLRLHLLFPFVSWGAYMFSWGLTTKKSHPIRLWFVSRFWRLPPRF